MVFDVSLGCIISAIFFVKSLAKPSKKIESQGTPAQDLLKAPPAIPAAKFWSRWIYVDRFCLVLVTCTLFRFVEIGKTSKLSTFKIVRKPQSGRMYKSWQFKYLSKATKRWALKGQYSLGMRYIIVADFVEWQSHSMFWHHLRNERA